MLWFVLFVLCVCVVVCVVVCLFVCLFVYLFVCLFVCLLFVLHLWEKTKTGSAGKYMIAVRREIKTVFGRRAVEL